MSNLIVEKISKRYGQVRALDSISLSVEPGELMVIMGPSGSGKTTLLTIILGLLRMDEGHIYLGERLIDLLPVEERHIGYVPQDFGLFPHLTVYDNVAFGLRVLNQSRSEMDAKIRTLLSSVDLDGLEGRRPNELSGGQKQRVALARALAVQPQLLLLDEPLSNIDEVTKAEVRRNLKETIKKSNVTTLCVMHDPHDSAELGDRIAVIYSGKIIQCGTPQELLKNPKSELVIRLITPTYSFNEKGENG